MVDILFVILLGLISVMGIGISALIAWLSVKEKDGLYAAVAIVPLAIGIASMYSIQLMYQ